MNFLDLNIQSEYRSFSNNMARDFYIPILKESILYQRAVGFFSSSILANISSGIEYLAARGGRIQLVASPRLQEKDVEAIQRGYQMRDDDKVHSVIQTALLRELLDTTSPTEERRLDLLANLIAEGCLDIKIALTKFQKSIGIYHEKMGIMKDANNNIIAFSGSMNESGNSLTNNYETVDVFRNWKSPFEAERVGIKVRAFENIWNDKEKNIVVTAFPEVNQEIIKKYRTTKIVTEYPEGLTTTIKVEGPVIPPDVKMRDYQIEAYQNWETQNYRGIFDMATGTGKTYTALASVCKMYEKLNHNLAIIIVCPFQHLVEQWKADIEKFGMCPVVCYSSSSQKDWKVRLKTKVNAFRFGAINYFCMVTTNATFSSDWIQNLLKSLRGNVLLIVDEAHNFGASNLQKALIPNAKYRMALSATIERHGDKEGTSVLYQYFGKKCIEYTLEDAIRNGMLTPYYYYPILVSLNDDERERYIELTRKITTALSESRDKQKKIKLTDYAKMLLIKRARIVEAASEKIPALRESIGKYKEKNHILVYCGATTVRDYGYQEGVPTSEEIRQIDAVTDLLGNQMGFRVAQFTSKEDALTRSKLIKSFDQGEMIQALIAIRCLDEGVNIPSIDKAFILASSTNPKEYIQRRGRVLRLYPGKNYAQIYDFITLPIPLDKVKGYATEDISGFKV